MRTLIFDQFEFERPDSEERLEISIAARSDFPFPTVLDFAASVLVGVQTTGLPEPLRFDASAGPGNVQDYLQHFAEITVPTNCEWPMYVVSQEWNDWDVLIEGPQFYIRYHWETFA